MSFAKAKLIVKEMTLDELQNGLAKLEFYKMQAEHYVRPNTLQYIMILMDMFCGELLNRDKSVRNDKEPRWSGPKCPDTFNELMSLGNGEVR